MESRTIETENRQDSLIKAMAGDDGIRITAVSSRNLVAEAQRIHSLSRVATAALGRMLSMTAILSSDLKNSTDRLSAILKGGGPGGNLVTTGLPNLDVKGTVGNPTLELPPNEKGKLDVSGFVGKEGQLTVVRDLSLKEPYVGSSPIVSGEIAEDFANYLLTSQQEPSIVYLGVRVSVEDGTVLAAGGVVAEPMPGCQDSLIDRLAGTADRIGTLAKRLETGEELKDVILDIFREFEPRILSEAVPHYRCDCSRERIEKALISVGKEELTSMIEEDHGAEVKCHFCNAVYRFSEAELKMLLYRATGGKPDAE